MLRSPARLSYVIMAGSTDGAGPPIWLQKATLPLGVMIARATGYRLPADQ